jgi:hypothetical protein
MTTDGTAGHPLDHRFSLEDRFLLWHCWQGALLIEDRSTSITRHALQPARRNKRRSHPVKLWPSSDERGR